MDISVLPIIFALLCQISLTQGRNNLINGTLKHWSCRRNRVCRTLLQRPDSSYTSIKIFNNQRYTHSGICMKYLKFPSGLRKCAEKNFCVIITTSKNQLSCLKHGSVDCSIIQWKSWPMKFRLYSIYSLNIQFESARVNVKYEMLKSCIATPPLKMTSWEDTKKKLSFAIPITFLLILIIVGLCVFYFFFWVKRAKLDNERTRLLHSDTFEISGSSHVDNVKTHEGKTNTTFTRPETSLQQSISRDQIDPSTSEDLYDSIAGDIPRRSGQIGGENNADSIYSMAGEPNQVYATVNKKQF